MIERNSTQYPEPAINSRRRTSIRLALPLALAAASLLLAQFAPAQSAEDLRVTIGKSLVIDYPADIGRISISNPEVLDAVPATSREFLLHGKSHGAATVVVWAKTGQRTMYNVNVEHNLEPIRRLLRETFPGEDIHVQSARDSLSLTGRVSSKEVSDRVLALASPLAKTVLNNLNLPALPVEQQIVLRVKFAEVNRNINHSFGANIISTGAANTPGRITTGQFPAPTPSTLRGVIPGTAQGTSSDFSISDALNIFAFRPDLNLAALVRALQSEGVLQILAEPNLVTTAGKEASFLVGGEFPVPVLQGGASAGAVTIQFREFGIRLTFNPQVTANGTIKLYVKPEVSTIDLANAVSVSGFLIPALATRRMETNIELGRGQSFVIGGLIDDRVTDSMSKIPGLSSIPVLGALFRSKNQSKSKTELVVIVTPEIAMPLNPGDPHPMPVQPREAMPATQAASKTVARLAPGEGKNGRNRKSKEAPLPPAPELIRTEPVSPAPAAVEPAVAPPVAEPAVAAPVTSTPPAEPPKPEPAAPAVEPETTKPVAESTRPAESTPPPSANPDTEGADKVEPAVSENAVKPERAEGPAPQTDPAVPEKDRDGTKVPDVAASKDPKESSPEDSKETPKEAKDAKESKEAKPAATREQN